MTLSDNAQKLLTAIKNKPLFESNVIEVLFAKPVYIGTMDPKFSMEQKEKAQTDVWQYECNMYSIGLNRPVNGKSVDFLPTANFWDTAYKAITELKTAGLIYAKNNGMNEFTYHSK